VFNHSIKRLNIWCNFNRIDINWSKTKIITQITSENRLTKDSTQLMKLVRPYKLRNDEQLVIPTKGRFNDYGERTFNYTYFVFI
ncbi:hypothetical protein BpHYR1_035975, partial [Brachionus plicatilis]